MAKGARGTGTGDPLTALVLRNRAYEDEQRREFFAALGPEEARVVRNTWWKRWNPAKDE